MTRVSWAVSTSSLKAYGCVRRLLNRGRERAPPCPVTYVCPVSTVHRPHWARRCCPLGPQLHNAGVAAEVSLQYPVPRSLGHGPLCLHVTLCYLLRLLGSPPPPRGVWGRRAPRRLFACRRETVEVRFTVPSPLLVLTRVAESYGSDIRGSAGAPGPASLCDAC